MEVLICPFCNKQHEHRNPYLNIICDRCGSKYYAIGDFWLNRETGEKRTFYTSFLIPDKEI